MTDTFRVPLVAAVVVAAVSLATLGADRVPPAADGFGPGARVQLDAHNAYPYNGRWADRLARALSTGTPLAIEQDLVWRPATATRPARSIVSHGEPFDDGEPSLRDHFFEAIRPVVEQALRDDDRASWPLVTLNLDLKTNEPEHHAAVWQLLGDYESWLTTAARTVDGSIPAPLEVGPVLVLTGESDAQAAAFHDAVPVGARLRLFGAVRVAPEVPPGADRDRLLAEFWHTLPQMALPRATNYRRWWNAPWAVVEQGGQGKAADWTPDDEQRLRRLVRHAHEAGLWVRFWTLNGHAPGAEKTFGWSRGYNFGSLDAVRVRWRAAIAAGADFVATDQYEAFAEHLGAARVTRPSLPESPREPGVREIVLEGTLTAADRLAWLERTFEVPPGTARLDVSTSYTGRDQGTAIEFGLFDPERFRGASRTSKDNFFLTRTAATPSYHPGPLQPGTWRLLLGIPSIRDEVTSTYRVAVRLTPEGAAEAPPLEVAPDVRASGPRWYRGDLHAHTLHSDGFGCADGRGGTGPCAVHMVADAAARRGLDFVAIADHNTTSHHAEMVAIQAIHERLLLLRAQEVTTFYGHANVYGTSEVIDFRIGPTGWTARDLFASVRRLGGLASINHPGRETGERCTGCGWNAPHTDYALVDAIEVVNGRVVTGPAAGQPFWHARLNEGHRLTGIGGSDDHGAATRPGSAIGTPTTVVFADELSEAALLAGLRAGRVFIRTRGPDGPSIGFEARGPLGAAAMGDVVSLGTERRRVVFGLEIEGGRRQEIEVIHNGRTVDGAAGPVPDAFQASVEFTLDVGRGDWVRVNLRDADGVTVIANPIYFR